LAGDGELHASHFPLVVTDIGLLNKKVAAAIKVAEDSPTESNIFLESAVDLGEAVLSSVEQNVPVHSGQNLLDLRGRPVVRIGTKLQAQQLVARTSDGCSSRLRSVGLVNERLRQGLDDAHCALGVFLLLLAFLVELLGIVHIVLQAGFFGLTLLRR